MMNQDDKRQERLLQLFDGLAEAALRDQDLAAEIVEDAGHDWDALRRRGASLARELYGQARLRHASERRQKTEESLLALREAVVRRLREAGTSTREALAHLLAGGDATKFQLHFRKIEELGEEDVVDMLTEAELLRVLEEMEADFRDMDRGSSNDADRAIGDNN